MTTTPANDNLRLALALALAFLGAALLLWGLCLGMTWPVSFAVNGYRGTALATPYVVRGALLAGVGGALLAGALLRATRPPR